MALQSEEFAARADDFSWCENLVRRSSSSLFRAFSLLPSPKRQSAFAVYAFCRQADDAVDRDASEERLLALRGELELFCAKKAPDKPLWRALETAFAAFQLDSRPFFDMLEGQRRDLSFRQPRTMAELEEYCYCVAGTAGLMLLPLLHARAPIDERMRSDAVALGVAMQLTNILRDVGEDLDAGRVYLPACVLDAAQCPLQALDARTPDAAFLCAWEAVAQRAEQLYEPMRRRVRELDEDSRLPLLAALLSYRAILDAVREDGYECLRRRSVVAPARAAALVEEAAALLR